MLCTCVVHGAARIQKCADRLHMMKHLLSPKVHIYIITFCEAVDVLHGCAAHKTYSSYV